jgi:hypothetical protein
MQRTREDLKGVSASFAGRDPARIAAEVVARMARGEPMSNEILDTIS